MNNNFKLDLYINNTKILIYADINDNNKILKHFLNWISKLQCEELLLDYYFSIRHIDQTCFNILNEFSSHHNVVFKDLGLSSNQNILNSYEVKNEVIKYAVDNRYDYVFFAKNNCIYHPLSLRQLVHANKHIIGNLIWINKDKYKIPNVWLKDQNSFSSADVNEQEFLNSLDRGNVVPVGGINDSLLISKETMLSGVNFEKIINLGYTNEYADLAVRAKVLGFDIYVDTSYPVYVLSDKNDINAIERLNV